MASKDVVVPLLNTLGFFTTNSLYDTTLYFVSKCLLEKVSKGSLELLHLFLVVLHLSQFVFEFVFLDSEVEVNVKTQRQTWDIIHPSLHLYLYLLCLLLLLYPRGLCDTLVLYTCVSGTIRMGFS